MIKKKTYLLRTTYDRYSNPYPDYLIFNIDNFLLGYFKFKEHSSFRWSDRGIFYQDANSIGNSVIKNIQLGDMEIVRELHFSESMLEKIAIQARKFDRRKGITTKIPNSAHSITDMINKQLDQK